MILPWSCAKLTSSILVIDTKALHDILMKEDIPNLSAKEKHIALEMLCLTQHLAEQQIKLCWVNSDQQLADGMTKTNAQDKILNFLCNNQRWNLVYDPTFTTAKKLRTQPQQVAEESLRDPIFLQLQQRSSGHVRNFIVRYGCQFRFLYCIFPLGIPLAIIKRGLRLSELENQFHRC